MEPHYNSVSRHVSVYQQGCMAVASNSLVYRCEPVFGAEVDVSPALHQDPDGLTSTRLTLHRQGQRSLWQTHTHAHTHTHTHTHNENWIKFIIVGGICSWAGVWKSYYLGEAVARLFAPRGGCWDTLWGNLQQYIPTIYSLITVKHFRPCFEVIFSKKQPVSSCSKQTD